MRASELRVALVSSLLAASWSAGALAQPWLDPPTSQSPQQAPAHAPRGERLSPLTEDATRALAPPTSADLTRRPPDPGSPTERGLLESDRIGAAEKLATSYLSYWSALNALTLEATPEFYAPKVVFHGREMTAGNIRGEAPVYTPLACP